ncbi:MAG TPA: chromate transporter [Kiritimatiellia bacterium]|nr:chromate transporter [Kiritimatiellia bacterium]HOE36084.1 chromate transporter [Kiritimatiellia bacterium]HOR73508.1 chromate transporter [Kiritimatiellia bacterium]HOU58102.1 chromate transporter [Kiritimatiellia bacterium]HPK68469.1 chromate transporter [Kiritimatiellia bacterium]
MRPTCLSIFWSFLRIGAGAFGGGMAALPVFEAELVNRRRWLSAPDTAELFAIAQSGIGVIIVNFAVLAGLRLVGKRGAFVAVVAVVLPAFFVILALAMLVAGNWENRWLSAALVGLRPAVVAIIVGAAWRLGRANLRTFWPILAAAACAVLLFQRVCSPVVLILLGIAVGLILHWLRRPRPAP